MGSGLRYLITGLASVAIYIGGVAIGHRLLGMNGAVANVLAYAISTVFNYLLNFHWSFKTKRRHSEALWRYLALSGSGLLLNAIYVPVMVRLLPISYETAAFTFSAMWPLVSFFSMRYWALR